MKKNNPKPVENPDLSESQTLITTGCAKVTPLNVNTQLQKSRRRKPASTIFKVSPDVATVTLLAHASETLASLSSITTGLANRLEGPHRSVAMALQQLAELTEMVVNQALSNLDSREPEPEIKGPVLH